VEARDFVDDESNESAHDESIRGASDDICELDVELLPVVLDPPAWEEASVDAVKTNDSTVTEEAIKEETDHTSDTMLSEHIEGVVNSDPELDYMTNQITPRRQDCCRTYS
jgi:hypothetical protein